MIRKLKQYLKAIWPGIGRAMVLSPDRAYIEVHRNPFHGDWYNLRQDAKRIGNDLVNKLKEHPNGNPSDHH